MKSNYKILLVAVSALSFQLLATLNSNQHLLVHISYALTGTAIGMMIGRHHCAPKLRRLTKTITHCSPDAESSDKQHTASCTVTVMRQYCYIIDTPIPQQICFWVKEEHKGQWNTQRGCCEIVLDGRLVCVTPKKAEATTK